MFLFTNRLINFAKEYAAGSRKDNQSKNKLKVKQPAKAMKQKNSLFVH